MTRRIGAAGVISLALALVATPPAAGAQHAPAKSAAKKKAPPKTTTDELLRLLAEQRTQIEAQQKLIAEQQAQLAEQAAKVQAQEGAIEEQAKRLAEMEQKLLSMTRRLDELQAELPGEAERKAIEDRLRQVEQIAQKAPELPQNVVSAGDFPGSIRIPGTDAAIKFGGRVRTAGVFTLASLGSEDRFLTNSIPVEADDEAAGKGPRTSFSANTSRFNFEMRTPTGVGQLRAFLEGDFFGGDGSDQRINFRLRHAFAQFKGIVVGQTWSTFSDPAADHEDMDFEGINGENVIRQPQIRYSRQVREKLSLAAAAETPKVSLTGGVGVNLIPDVVGRAIWSFQETGHLQTAVVLRQIRGESDLDPDSVKSVFAWGASLSGVLPFRHFNLTDRFIFQVNIGKGNARYINDFSSLGGQDGVFNPVTGTLEPLSTVGGYVDYEHQWKEWKTTREMKLRSSIIWSYVVVKNLAFQLDDAYRKTNRLSVNLVFSPTQRINVGVQYIYGTRQNKDGNRGNSDQCQVVGIFRF